MKDLISAFTLTATVAFAPAAWGGEETPLQEEQLAGRLTLAPATPVHIRFPVQQVLDALASGRGLSFVFDSKALAGKSIRPVDMIKNTESDLAGALLEADLELRKISKKTYAVIVPRDDEIAARKNIEVAPTPSAATDVVLVTGFLPREPLAPSSKHIFSISEEDLSFAAALSPADAVNDLPQSIASVAPGNTTLLESAAGLALADLRGLGPDRTLVLVNGRKRTATLGGNSNIKGVDLSAIPTAFLERIEIQSASGGALLDDSAIAGVVNLVVKSPAPGLTLGAQSGISQEGDAFNTSVHALAAQQITSRLHAEGGFEFFKSESVVGANRDFFYPAYGFALNGVRSVEDGAVFTPGFGGSVITPAGAFIGAVEASGFTRFQAPLIPARDGSVSPYIGALDQLYQWPVQQTLVPGLTRAATFVNADYKLSDEWRVFIETDISRTLTRSNLAPTPAPSSRGRNPVAGDAIMIPIDNPTLPASIRNAALAAFGPDVAAVVFEHRFEEAGPRRTKIERTSINLVAGVEREADDFEFAASYRLGRNQVKATDIGRLDLTRLEIALDPQACAITTGCQIADFFGRDQLSDETLNYITIPKINRILKLTEHEFAAGFSKALSENDRGETSIAAGIEFRRTSFSDADDIAADVRPIGQLGGDGSAGSQSSFEAYSTLQKTIYNFINLPGSIDVLLAARAMRPSHGVFFGNFESGIDWSPASWISLHARQETGKRAPSIFDQRYRGVTLYQTFTDPCAPEFRKGEIEVNCSSNGPLGVGPGFVQTASLAEISPIANPDLRPERFNSRAYGVTINPTDIFGIEDANMSLSATWIEIDIKDGIDQRSNELLACYESVAFSSSSCAPDPETGAAAITRDPLTRQITSFSTRLQNTRNLSWRGLDLELKYRQELPSNFPADAIWLSALHTYTQKVTSSYSNPPLADAEGFARLDGLVDYPHHRTLFSVGAKQDSFSIVMFGTRRGAARTSSLEIDEAFIPPAWYIDLSGRIDIAPGSYVQLSIENIGNEQPAITAFNNFGNFAPEYYDPIGRRFSVSIKSEF